jgi:hypothetical protein
MMHDYKIRFLLLQYPSGYTENGPFQFQDGAFVLSEKAYSAQDAITQAMVKIDDEVLQSDIVFRNIIAIIPQPK